MVMVGAALIAGTAGQTVLEQPAFAATTLNVATTGSDTGNCQVTACLTLGYALSQAASGDTIMIASGSYPVTNDPPGTSNTVPTALTGLTIESVLGNASSTIVNAVGAANGLVINANNITVEGLTFENAGAAGVLVSPPQSAMQPASVSGETIQNDVIDNSDQCELTPQVASCAAAIGAGDYGESMWLMSVINSTVRVSTIENGLAGGLLISDELGPNDGNTIDGNNVLNNIDGCGITLASHNKAAIWQSGPNVGRPDPTAAGVYDNTIQDNATNGSGANGIGLFNAAYDNTIQSNSVNGNGGPGIEIDDDVPSADLNFNSIIGNTVGVNSLLGGPGGDSPGQHTVHTTQTGGVLIIARVTSVTGTVIEDNTITGDYFGIWMSALAGGRNTSLSGNVITVAKGGVPVFIEPAPDTGYWEFGSDGGVFSFGTAPYEGSTGGLKLAQPVVGMAATPDGGGYWLAARDGGIFAFGDADYYGSLPGVGIKVTDIVGIAATADGGGYWLAAKDGGIFAFGDAVYHGSLPGLGVKVTDIVGIAPTPDGGGYFLAATDGGIFTFGDAVYFASLPGLGIHESDVVGIAPNLTYNGYWLVASNGGLFAFDSSAYFGSLPGLGIHVSDIVGIAANPDQNGYWVVGSDGGIFGFGYPGYESYFGSLPALHIHVSDIVGVVATP